MPLIALAGAGLNPVRPPRVPSPGVDTRYARFTWIDPTGRVWSLDTPRQGWFLMPGATGLGAAPISHVTDPHPRGGSRIRHTQPQSRVIDLPLDISGDDHSQFQSRLRDLIEAFTSTRRLGPGRLQVARPDGTVREIRAYYEAGFDGQTGNRWASDAVIITLFCEDPYWQDVEPQPALVRAFTTGRPFLRPFMSVSTSKTVNAPTIMVNSGSVEAWPEWTITGPMTTLVSTNITTGESFTLTHTLLPGQTITITTDPPTVRGPAGQVLTSALNWPGAVLWGLAPGQNLVDFDLSGASAGASVSLTFTRRHESA